MMCQTLCLVLWTLSPKLRRTLEETILDNLDKPGKSSFCLPSCTLQNRYRDWDKRLCLGAGFSMILPSQHTNMADDIYTWYTAICLLRFLQNLHNAYWEWNKWVGGNLSWDVYVLKNMSHHVSELRVYQYLCSIDNTGFRLWKDFTCWL